MTDQIKLINSNDYTEFVDLQKDYSNLASGAASFIEKFAASGEITHNPLKDITRDQCIRLAWEFADKHDLSYDRETFIKGALLAQSGETELLTEEELQVVTVEASNRWNHPRMLYYLCIMCAMCAVVQGMDETVVNGAQTYFFPEFGIDKGEGSEWLQGLVVGAPYLACAVIGCAITGPLNRLIGRRGVIFVSCAISAIASIWEAFTYNWKQLFASRLLLGLGIGAKSITTPIYSAECAPANIRGAMVMTWQMWTAFGIMLGYILCVAFKPSDAISTTLAWRLMLGSTVVAPTVVCMQVFFVPESPRWYIARNRHDQAYESLIKLRGMKLLAARDLFYMSIMIEISEEINHDRNIIRDILTIPRNLRALRASQIICFLQQACGINIIMYYSTGIVRQAQLGETQALLSSMGFGMVNFVFAIPAVFTIDTFGRRSLTLATLPFLAIFLMMTGLGFYIDEQTNRSARVAVVLAGIYIYTAFYSIGMGPVPFTYTAEAFPLHVRDLGMTMGIITLWSFNFILSLTFPALTKAFKPQGAFFFYAAWNAVGFFLVFFFVPETKLLTLEEIDIVFSIPTREFIKFQIKHIPYNLRKHVLHDKRLPRRTELYQLN